MKLTDLELLVCYECYCSLDIFWENVGKDKKKVIEEVKNAKSKSELMEIIGEYI